MAAGGLPLVVGDWVVIADGTVSDLVPRTSLLRRSDASGDREQALVANLDLLVIVAGLDRPVKAGRLQRTVALGWDAGAVPLVVLTKADVVADPEAARAAAGAAIPGVEVLALSAARGEGLKGLHRAIAGKTVVLLGESGAGKSTLANALVGEEVAATGAVRHGDAKGRHTTTSRQLHLLPGGGALIDTPGIRGVGLWVDAAAVDATFADLVDLAGGCRFQDCRHDHEPGCAVRSAAAAGSVDPARLDAWNRMHREVAAAALRADEHARNRSERRVSPVGRHAQRRKGGR
ncbi:MAG: ribosome small subunit-dependent GTPase A [Actinobacteria bacterium]|nr:ribosome small subunit-dependent GTPase A [Actinomycetota bacterium]MBW3641531.1 ribosome small subunit-dependent GTPase A [Actinomycetota bacterium]